MNSPVFQQKIVQHLMLSFQQSPTVAFLELYDFLCSQFFRRALLFIWQ